MYYVEMSTVDICRLSPEMKIYGNAEHNTKHAEWPSLAVSSSPVHGVIEVRECVQQIFHHGMIFPRCNPQKGSHSDGMLNHPLGLQSVDGQWMMGSWDS